MSQAIVWMQFVLWALFLLGTAGCVISVLQAAAAGHKRTVLVDIAAWILTLVVFVALHRVIALAL